MKSPSPLRVSILGAGHIARKMATTVAFLRNQVTPRAVASRDPARAKALADEFGFETSFGSYEELAADPDTDLVYVATPNTLHARHTLLCLAAGKHVLCEKPFTANAREAEAVVRESRARGLFCGEAMWTRFLPAWRRIGEILRSGRIGEPRLIEASFAIPVSGKERLLRPELGGGALLDLGIYPIAFALQFFGADFARVSGRTVLAPTGVDDQSAFSLEWADGRLASLSCSMSAASGAWGRISGSRGRIEVPALTRCEGFRIAPFPDGPAEDVSLPFDCNGYEYEILAACRAIAEGRTECEESPMDDTLAVLRAMDSLRALWGVRFPCDEPPAP